MKRIFTTIGFSLSLSLIVLNLIDVKYVLIISVGLASLFGVSLLLSKYRKALVVPISLASCLLACFLMAFNYYSVAKPQMELDDKKAEIIFYATENPSQTTNGYSFDAKIIELKKSGTPQNINTAVIIDSNTEITPYRLYKANAKFDNICNNAFFSKGKWADKIFVRTYLNDAQPLNAEIKGVSRLMFDARQRISEHMLSTMDEDSAGLSIALVTGDKDYLSYDIREAFALSGASHIMAISGLHLGLVVGAGMLLLKRLKMPKYFQGIYGVVASLTYMALVGFSGSITRAGIMMIVLSLGLMFKKRSDALNSLGIAVFLMCINPYAVCDVGAVLSVVAVLSLLTVYPLVSFSYMPVDPYEITPAERIMQSLVKLASGVFVTLVVTICSLPVLYMFYGYVSIVAPLTNLVVLPLGGISMYLSFANLLVDISCVTEFFNGLILEYVRFISSFDSGVVGLNSYNHIGFAIAGVFVLLAVYFAMQKRVPLKLFATLSVFLILATSVVDYAYLQNNAMIYISNGGAYVIKYDGYIVAGGVNDINDYRDVKAFARVNNNSIDYLIVDDSYPYYSAYLSQNVNVNTLVFNDIDETTLNSARCNKLEPFNKFNLTLAEDYKMYYNFGITKFEIKGVTFSVGDNLGDIVLGRDRIYDKHGTVSLSKGDVLYFIENENTYNCRRISIWQE